MPGCRLRLAAAVFYARCRVRELIAGPCPRIELRREIPFDLLASCSLQPSFKRVIFACGSWGCQSSLETLWRRWRSMRLTAASFTPSASASFLMYSASLSPVSRRDHRLHRCVRLQRCRIHADCLAFDQPGLRQPLSHPREDLLMTSAVDQPSWV
jgi:hypothetical protein